MKKLSITAIVTTFVENLVEMSFGIEQKRLLDWYENNQRELPWRETNDPYLIWISEVILQQTRIDQGLGYYLRFVERFPNVEELASADEDEVLKYWQGLGYYSRARNMHSAAKMILTKFGGVFPKNYSEIRAMKGVGDYTAAAISSIAFNLPFATIDGNVYRVLSRIYGIDTPIDSTQGKKIFAELAQQLLPKNNVGEYNQAMMEFGAIQCVPRNPNCESCVFSDRCFALSSGAISKFPVKSTKTIVKNRYFNYFIINNEGSFYLNKRLGNDIWRNLYEFPLIETDKYMELDELKKTELFHSIFAENYRIEIDLIVDNYVHVLSHRRIVTNCYSVVLLKENNYLRNCVKVDTTTIDSYPISRLSSYLLENFIF